MYMYSNYIYNGACIDPVRSSASCINGGECFSVSLFLADVDGSGM